MLFYTLTVPSKDEESAVSGVLDLAHETKGHVP